MAGEAGEGQKPEGFRAASASVAEAPRPPDSSGEPKREPNAERSAAVEQLQQSLREVNNRPEVGGKMLVEMPLGDGTDRVVTVLRPDAIDSVLPIMEKEFNSNLPPESQIDGELVRNFANERIAVVLPEVGMTWIRADRAIKPDSIRGEVTRIIDHQGRQPRSFLEVAKLEGLNFAVHRGMEQDDRPSYISDDIMDAQGATIIQRNPAREASEETHWQGGVAIGVMETVRGEASAEMFDIALKGAYEKAKEQVKYLGPSPDKMLAGTLATVQGLK